MENVKVVIVEDDDEVRELLIDAFEFFLNREVVAFSTADSALEHILLSEPQLVISDVDMPGELNGIGLLKRVKQALPETVFISMSGRDGNSAEAEANGADGFILKPFKLNDLVKVVEKFIVP